MKSRAEDDWHVALLGYSEAEGLEMRALAADARKRPGTVCVGVLIVNNPDPSAYARYTQYVKPLSQALREAGLGGEITGDAGTLRIGSEAPRSDFDLYVSDWTAADALIKAKLIELGAPVGSRVIRRPSI